MVNAVTEYEKAASAYAENPTTEVLDAVAKDLCGRLTLREKLRMISGRFVWITLLNWMKTGRWFNVTPYPAGGVKRLGIPEIRFTDGPRGVVVGSGTCFPSSMCRGASFDPVLEYRIGVAMAREAIAGGANLFGGICVNLLRNPRWGRAQETYGEDPHLLGEMGAALTRGVQDNGVLACVKHFACNSIENLRFTVNVELSDRTLHEVYLPHFKKCVDAGAASIMGAYNRVRGEYCCESTFLLTDILRKRWGFEGFTVSDFIWGVRDARKAIAAGMDIEMPQNWKFLKVRKYLKTGEILMEDIDRNVRNILKGLLRVTTKAIPYGREVVACGEHAELAREAAEKGTVLLKNDGVLPFKMGMKIAVVGRYADAANTGDLGSSHVRPPYVVTPYRGLREVFGADNVVLYDGTDVSRAKETVRSCDAAVVCVGCDHTLEGEYLLGGKRGAKKAAAGVGGDRKNLRIPENEAALIGELAGVNRNLVVSITGGGAFITNDWSDSAGAVLLSFYGGMEGGRALANLLSGKVDFSGRLPFTVATREEDYPEFLTLDDGKAEVEYGYFHGYSLFEKTGKPVEYPFGFGLSYTTFETHDLRASVDGTAVLATVSVRNTGSVPGCETVQIYVGSGGGGADVPVKRLMGFAKVPLQPGETREVTVRIDSEDLKFLDDRTMRWHLDPVCVVYAGSDSRKAGDLSCELRVGDAPLASSTSIQI